MRIWFSRKEAGWDANNFLPNSSPLARLDCDSCCVLRKLNADMLKGFLQESEDRLILRGSLPLLLLARAVPSSTYRHLCRSSFPSPHLFMNPCTKSGWTLGDWSATGRWVPAVFCAMELPWHIQLLQSWGHRIYRASLPPLLT